MKLRRKHCLEHVVVLKFIKWHIDTQGSEEKL